MIMNCLFAFTQILLHLGVTVQNVESLCRAIVADPSRTPSLTGATPVDVQFVYHLWCYLRHCAWEVAEIDRRTDTETVAAVAQFQSVIDSIASLMDDLGVRSRRAGNILSPADAAAASIVWNGAWVEARTFCTTKQNRICNGMNEVKEGDVTAAFQSVDRLYILRPVGNQYKLIGDAYVDGLMEGEGYEGLNPDEVDYEIELI